MKPFTKSLTINSVGLDVMNLQTVLEKLGYGDFVPTGFFGQKTRSAVIAFQKKYGIFPALGYFGELTRRKMNDLLFSDSKSEILYFTAVGFLHVDASPNDRAPDEVGCADTVNSIFAAAFGEEIGGSTSTRDLFLALKTSPKFRQVESPVRGDIVISPTGYGNGGLTNGHVGIIGDGGKIMSNSSSTGTFEQNYDINTWRARYVGKGGFPMYYYHLV